MIKKVLLFIVLLLIIAYLIIALTAFSGMWATGGSGRTVTS